MNKLTKKEKENILERMAISRTQARLAQQSINMLNYELVFDKDMESEEMLETIVDDLREVLKDIDNYMYDVREALRSE